MGHTINLCYGKHNGPPRKKASSLVALSVRRFGSPGCNTRDLPVSVIGVKPNNYKYVLEM